MVLFLGILFALAVALALGLGHWYLWRRLVVDTRLGRPWRPVAGGLLWTAALGLPVTVFVARQTANPFVTPLVFLGFTWMGLLFYLVVLLILRDAVFLGFRFRRRRAGRDDRPAAQADPNPAMQSGDEQQGDKIELDPAEAESSEDVETAGDPSRRLFLTRASAGVVVAGAAAVGLTGLRSAVWDIETPEVEVRLQRLPRALSGYRIAVLSDLHLGPTLGAKFVARVIELTRRQKPDLVAITGDLVDGSVRRLGSVVRPLADLSARDGVFFVTGNHEYYSGVDAWVAFLKSIGIEVLMNSRVAIRGRQGFDLAGVPDFRAAVFRPGMGPKPREAVSGRDPDRELVMLAHQPVQIRANAAVQPGLQISGHTHGGQIWPWGYMVRLTQPYLSGLHRYDAHCQVFVTRGAGYWGPPIRFLAPAEIPCLVLVSA